MSSEPEIKIEHIAQFRLVILFNKVGTQNLSHFGDGVDDGEGAPLRCATVGENTLQQHNNLPVEKDAADLCVRVGYRELCLYIYKKRNLQKRFTHEM